MTRAALREAAYGLRRLVDGDLCGMFDGPTTAAIDLEAPVVAFDLSRITDYTSLGVVMICVSAWLRRLLAEPDDGVRRIIVTTRHAIAKGCGRRSLAPPTIRCSATRALEELAAEAGGAAAGG